MQEPNALVQSSATEDAMVIRHHGWAALLPAPPPDTFPHMAPFAVQLRTYRERAGLSYAQIERNGGPDKTTVQRYENCVRVPSRESTEKLIAALPLTAQEQAKLLLYAGYVPETVRQNAQLVTSLAAIIAAVEEEG